jgi:hypothetical protein
MPDEHKGWYVPRALPHFDSPEVTQAITFRLADALPRDVVAARKDETAAAHRRRLSAALDAGHGECLLRDRALAEIVEAALLHGVGIRYELFAWVIMPNHVHVLFAPIAGNRLTDIVHAWKSWRRRRSIDIAASALRSGSGSISIGSFGLKRISRRRSPTSRTIPPKRALRPSRPIGGSAAHGAGRRAHDLEGAPMEGARVSRARAARRRPSACDA